LDGLLGHLRQDIRFLSLAVYAAGGRRSLLAEFERRSTVSTDCCVGFVFMLADGAEFAGCGIHSLLRRKQTDENDPITKLLVQISKICELIPSYA
jgi:hypothetical protein